MKGFDKMKPILPAITVLLLGATALRAGPIVSDETAVNQYGSATSGVSPEGLTTRNALYWMTHASSVSGEPECVTLLNAISSNGSQLDLGFIRLPLEDHDQDGVLDFQDALVEALGLYWRDRAVNRPLNDKKSPALVCRRRKQLAVELITATANTVYLGASPTNFIESGDMTFPADLLEQAREVARGVQPDQMAAFTLLLRKFNNSGVTNDLRGGLIECSPENRSDLRKIARNPTTRANCRAQR